MHQSSLGAYCSYEGAKRAAVAYQVHRVETGRESPLQLIDHLIEGLKSNGAAVGVTRGSRAYLLGRAAVFEGSSDKINYYIDEFEIQGSPLEALAQCAEETDD